jgi:hypothetical protein
MVAAMRVVRVRNATRGTVVADQAEVAEGPVRRMVGLMGRRGWSESDGLLLRRRNAIQTCFMRMPIDVLFVGRDSAMLDLAPARRPWRLGPLVWRASSVLELPIGAIEASRTRLDDRLVVEPTALSPSWRRRI